MGMDGIVDCGALSMGALGVKVEGVGDCGVEGELDGCGGVGGGVGAGGVVPVGWPTVTKG